MMENNFVIKGDCLAVMKTMEENSIDAIITDPPYGLSFMGKKWDYAVPSVEIWQECLRVLKPGGYLLSFAGTRTQHRMACNIEDAGFEIRDMIAWVYGSGFPKSLNIGKAVDKLQGNEREVVGEIRAGSTAMGQNSGWNEHENKTVMDLTKGTSEWEGWGTALKPALEPITVARKPLSEKTVAENVLKWGTGGINIDGSRVEANEELGRNNNARIEGTSYVVQKETMRIDNSNGKRFPANLIHDNSEEVRECFPETNPSKKAARGGTNPNPMDWGNGRTDGDIEKGHDDNGGNASRFFKSIIYQAKASRSERNRGCDELEEKNIDYEGRTGQNNSTHRPDGSERKENVSKNNHPTVKPIALMEYLVKLITQEGAIVLDPFAGSGTTGIACQNVNRNFILIEKEQEYINIINKRRGYISTNL